MCFYKDAPRVKKGQIVDVKPIDVKGYKNVLGVFVHDVQIGNIISTLTIFYFFFRCLKSKHLYTIKNIIRNNKQRS